MATANKFIAPQTIGPVRKADEEQEAMLAFMVPRVEFSRVGNLGGRLERHVQGPSVQVSGGDGTILWVIENSVRSVRGETGRIDRYYRYVHPGPPYLDTGYFFLCSLSVVIFWPC